MSFFAAASSAVRVVADIELALGVAAQKGCVMSKLQRSRRHCCCTLHQF
jgi:hypothetical protein